MRTAAYNLNMMSTAQRTPENDLQMEYCFNCHASCEKDSAASLPKNPVDGQEEGQLTFLGNGWNFWACRECMLECRAAEAIEIETGCEFREVNAAPGLAASSLKEVA